MASLREIWKRFKLGKADIKEKKRLLEAIDNEDTDLEGILYADWKNTKVAKIGRKERNEAWENLAHSIDIKKRNIIQLYRYGVAAGMAALIGLSIFLYLAADHTVEVQVASGEKVKEVLLPDGSRVWINHASSISYPKKFGPESRNLVLKGHAFFEIEKNPSKPFLVDTEGLSIKVLGTSFDVYNFKDESATVSVKSGKVEVSHSDSDSKIVLLANERSLYDSEQERLVKTTFDSETIMAWRNNVLYFENLELGQAIKQIERKYGVHIICADPELLGIRIRASYAVEPLDSVLTDLAFMTNFDFKKNENNNEITLKSMDMDTN